MGAAGTLRYRTQGQGTRPHSRCSGVGYAGRRAAGLGDRVSAGRG